MKCLLSKFDLEMINAALKMMGVYPESLNIAREIIIDNDINPEKLRKEGLTDSEVHGTVCQLRGKIKTYLQHEMCNEELN